MEVDVSVTGIILAAASVVVVGSVWYSDKMFGKQWKKIIGLKDADMKKAMGPAMGWMVVVSLLTAYVLDHFINYIHNFETDISWVSAGFWAGFWVWLGFGLTTIIAHGVFEPRDKKVMWIHAGNRLVTLLVMGLILGYFLGN